MQMKTEYFVNEEKRTVVCKLTYRVDGYGYGYAITAKAVCSPDDLFDAEIGRRIADSRAHIAYHKQMSQLKTERLDRHIKAALELQKEISRHKDIVGYMSKRIQKVGK